MATFLLLMACFCLVRGAVATGGEIADALALLFASIARRLSSRRAGRA